MLYDLFICHASEDKDSVVRPLAESLKSYNVEVWYDEFCLKLGDSIRQAIDNGLSQSRFGVIILSKAFFEKKWPQYELDGLAEIEMRGKDKIMLPIWHDISHDDVMHFSPSLSNRQAVSTSDGLEKVVKAILEVIHPQGSPLIAARDYLLEWGITPPVITDEYWLEVVEASNRLDSAGAAIPNETIWGRWSFPLGDKGGGTKQWGEKLAWTSMQLDWTLAVEEIPITPLTEPKVILDFIDSFVGLYETCKAYPLLVAEYAPQLTIPNMGGKLEQTFEEQYQKSLLEQAGESKRGSTSGTAQTIDGKIPLCGEEWALRHDTFGNFKAVHIAHEYFSGGMFGPHVSPYEHPDHVFWLLSSASEWLPEKIHLYLIQGMAEWSVWTWSDFSIDHGGKWDSNGALADALYDTTIEGNPFIWSTKIEDDILNRINYSIELLSLPESPDRIMEKFLKFQFIEKYLLAMKRRGKR